jgi:hypothetical protein
MLTANQAYYTHYNLSAETALQKLMEGNEIAMSSIMSNIPMKVPRGGWIYL